MDGGVWRGVGCRGWLHGGVVTRAGAPGRVTEGCIIAHLVFVFWRQATSSSIMHVHNNNNSRARRPIDKTSTSKKGGGGVLFVYRYSFSTNGWLVVGIDE